MGKKLLVHSIEWKKATDEQIDTMIGELSSIGIRDIVLHPEWAKRDQGNGNYLKMIHRKINSFGLSTPACHGLWGREYDLNCPEENRRKQITLAHSHFMNRAAEMGCLTYTVHLGDRHPDYSKEYSYDLVRRTLDELLPDAEKSGIKIAMENMIDYDTSNEVAALASEYNHPALGLCLDTGHAHVKEGVKTAIENMAPYLFTCHLQDNDGKSDQHYPPGHGSIDWKFLVPALKSSPKIITAETEAGPCDDLSIVETW